VEAGEACDGRDLGGKSCSDFGFSNPAGLSCTDACENDVSGCSATCDGALLERGEECDGANLGGHDCVDAGFVSPDGATCVSCEVDFAGCQANCGNGVLEPGETCDGSDLGGETCAAYGFVNPDGLGCASSCDAFDSETCTAECNGVLEPGEECDGSDLAGHDCSEFGFSEPLGLTCDGCALDASTCSPTCGDGNVEPGEECDDHNSVSGDGCSSSCAFEGTECANAYKLTLGLGTTTINGSTVLGGSHSSAFCADSGGPDRIYAVTLAENGFLTASLKRGVLNAAATNYDSVLYIRNQCGSGTFGCADSTTASPTPLVGGEVISVRGQAFQTFWIFVDGTTGQSGNYELVLDLSKGADCSDPVPIPLEAGSPMRLFGGTFGAGNDSTSVCGGQSSPDVVYAITSSVSGPVGVKIDGNQTFFDSVMYEQASCGLTNVACQDVAGNGGESASYLATSGAPFYTWIDGSFGAAGSYQLVVTPP
jgi:cysteine-rich repeat protein